MTHICISKLTVIGSHNGLSPGRREAIIWTNAEILFIEPLGTNFSDVLIGIITSSFKKMHLKVSSAKRRPFCLSLNVLMQTLDPISWAEHPSAPTTSMCCAVAKQLLGIPNWGYQEKMAYWFLVTCCVPSIRTAIIDALRNCCNGILQWSFR